MRPVAPLVLLLTLMSLLPIQPAGAQPASKHPPHVIAGSELRVLPPTADGRRYQLHVHLPASFAREPQRRWPVLYVTDAYWDFPTVVVSYNNQVYDRVLPEFIVVGLGYAGENPDFERLRQWELSPVPLTADAAASGHAERFLATIEREIIPFMEREYRAHPSQRMLAGSSLGGLFALYAMYTKPTLFQGYVAASPAVVAGRDWILQRAREVARAGTRIDARLYVTGAEYEWPAFLAGIRRYQQALPELKHPGLVYENRTIDGERHAGTKAESYARGMRFVFAPLAPESGPSKD